MALRVPYPWISRSTFWKSLSPRSNGLLIAGVFVLFFTGGLLGDIPRLGASSSLRLLASSCFAGGLAVAYVLVVRMGPRWLLLLIAAHILITLQFDQLFGVAGPPLVGDALRARMAVDVNGTTTAIIVSFVLLMHVIRIEGTRYGRIHAEISLARDIHRRLVPRITTRSGGFEFRGVSLPSGEVGGDLIDLVEHGHRNGWTSLLADVSGHGVAAGLLMGMVKSAARTQLRDGTPLDRLLTTLNAVLFDLKSPTMFVTFVGLQYNGDGSTLRFTVAGHLPILHYRAATTDIVEVSIAQLPLAMFDNTSYTAAEVSCADGDLFVLLTDGLTEVFDTGDREFGLDRMKMLVRDHAGAPLEQLEERLLAAVRAHGPQLDDQTVFLIRRSS
jgi:serine phosphatase RsbU (regulator of sigma subunit)